MVAFKPYNFVSLDGTDENGVRAEVFVQINNGPITEIKENSEKQVAEIQFKLDHLKYPLRGWIRTDNEVFEEAKRAHENKENVEFRIETQRKKGIDRTIPIEDLKNDMKVARDSIRPLLVGINGKYTNEMVTNPNEDPLKTSSNRYVAGDSDASKASPTAGGALGSVAPESATILTRIREACSNPQVRQPVIDQMVALALFNGVDSSEISDALVGNDKRVTGETPADDPRAAFSQEAPAWREVNSDGRRNLGSNTVSAGVSSESVVYKYFVLTNDGELLTASNVGEVIEFFANLIMTISDSIQKSVYELTSSSAGGRVDRGAGSHVRVRGIVYDTIERSNPLPVELVNGHIVLRNGTEGLQEWIKNVGGTSKERFIRAIKVSDTYKSFKELTPPLSVLDKSTVPGSAPLFLASPPEAVATPNGGASGRATSVAEQAIPEYVSVDEEIPPYSDEDYNPSEEESTLDSDYDSKVQSNQKTIVNPQVAKDTVSPTTEEPVKAESVESKSELSKKIADLKVLADSVPAVENPELKLKSKAERLAEQVEEDGDESEETVVVESDYVTDEILPMYEKQSLEGWENAELADEESIQMFKDMFFSAGFDISDSAELMRISKLLAYTFGQSNARKIPKELLMDFTDYYAAGGTSTIDHAMRVALGDA